MSAIAPVSNRLRVATLPGRLELVRVGPSGRFLVTAPGLPDAVVDPLTAVLVAEVAVEEGGRLHDDAYSPALRRARLDAPSGAWERADARASVRTRVLEPFGVPTLAPAERVPGGLARNASVDSLRAWVSANGGSVTGESDYRYTRDQGGDGESGHYRVRFADRTGTEVGSVGFSRSLDASGRPVLSRAVDFTDLRGGREDGFSAFVHDAPERFALLLASLADAPTEEPAS